MQEVTQLYYAIGTNLVIIPFTQGDAMTESGIYIPQEVTDVKLSVGTVESKGAECSDEVQVGDIVYFSKHSPQQLEGDTTFWVIPEGDILARGPREDEV